MNTSGIFFNQSFDKKRLKALIEWILKTFGEKEALRVVEELKRTGFKNATRAGISLGLHELTTPPNKAFLISNAQVTMNITQHDFMGARITATERSQRIVDTWHRVSETLRKQVVDYFSTYDQLNPIYIMALSGARGNFSQVRQLVGMRGLMADPQGKIISFPIRSNLREGLTLTEYFISCSGARKGLVDTALRTADTGYLTRRLVDVSHHIVVKRVACNTHKGILIKKLQSNNKTLLSLKDRLIGRVLAENINSIEKQDTCTIPNQKKELILTKEKNNSTDLSIINSNPTQAAIKNNLEIKNIFAQKNQEIFPDLAFSISCIRQEVLIRSPLTCAFNHELCQLCYGWSLSQGNLVALGEAVGVIAAQSIGEPGTQLTMRTFHTGGVFSGDLLQEIRASHSGKISYSRAVQGLLIRTTHGKIAFLTKTPGEIILVTDSSNKQKTHFSFQKLSMLFVRQGEYVEKNQLLAEVSDFGDEGNQSIKSQQTIFAELSGRVVEIKGGSVNRNDLDNEEENEEDEPLHQIEPEKSGKLGLFKILSIGMGASSNFWTKQNEVPFKKSISTDFFPQQNFVQKSTLLDSRRTLFPQKKRPSTNKIFKPQSTRINEKKQKLLRTQRDVTKKYVPLKVSGIVSKKLKFVDSEFLDFGNNVPENQTLLMKNRRVFPRNWKEKSLSNRRSLLKIDGSKSKKLSSRTKQVFPFVRAAWVRIANSGLNSFDNLKNYGQVLPPFSIPTKNSTFDSSNPPRAIAGVFPLWRQHLLPFISEIGLGRNVVSTKKQINSSLLRKKKKALSYEDQKLSGYKTTTFFFSERNGLKQENHKHNSKICTSTGLFYLRTIAEEGDLVNEDYKHYRYPF